MLTDAYIYCVASWNQSSLPWQKVKEKWGLISLFYCKQRKCSFSLVPLQAGSWIYVKMGNLSNSPDSLISRNKQLLTWNYSTASSRGLTRYLFLHVSDSHGSLFLIFISVCFMKRNIKKHTTRSNGCIRRHSV